MQSASCGEEEEGVGLNHSSTSYSSKRDTLKKRLHKKWLDIKTAITSNSTQSRVCSKKILEFHKWLILLTVIIGVTWIVTKLAMNADANIPLFIPVPVIHGENGIDLTHPSVAADCEALINSETFVEMMYAFERLLSKGDDFCICAPVYGQQVRYACWNDAELRPVHAFNPFMLGAPLRSYGRSRVSESQEWIGLTGTNSSSVVKNIRFNAMTIQYRNIYCKDDSRLVQNEVAWCLQSCLDLLDGISVYERARRDQSQ